MDALKFMLLDVVTELRHECAALKQQGDKLNDFDLGRRFGLFEALSLIDSQAKAFGIERSEIGLTFNVDELIFD